MVGKNVTYIEDKELLQRFYDDHDNQWLGVLLPRYTILLLGVCMKYLKNEDDARDAVQQVFLKVIKELPKYKVDYFKSWIYMIAKNHCLMQLRGGAFNTTEISERTEFADNGDAHLEYLKSKEETLDRLEIALTQLNAEQRQCITLFYIDKKSYNDIVEITGFSLLQVKSFIQNGKRNLKQMIQNSRRN